MDMIVIYLKDGKVRLVVKLDLLDEIITETLKKIKADGDYTDHELNMLEEIMRGPSENLEKDLTDFIIAKTDVDMKKERK